MLVNTHLLWSNVTRKQETKRNNSSSFDEFVQFSKYSWLNWIMYTFYYAAWWRHFWWWSLFTERRTCWNILLRFRSLIFKVVSSNPAQFSVGSRVSSTNKSDRHVITEILLKVALNTIILVPCLLNFDISVKAQWQQI